MLDEQHSSHLDPAFEKSELPDGYYKKWDGDFIWLMRPDGSVVGIFSDMGATDEGIANCAWNDAPSREMSVNHPQARL